MATKDKEDSGETTGIEQLTKEDVAQIGLGDKQEKPKTEDFITRENERIKAKNYDNEQKIRYLEKKLAEAQEEKRKPGIQVDEADGTRNRNKRPNTSGLSDLILPPYTKNMVAIYRIIGTEEINPATGLKVDPVDTLIPGRYTLHDKFEKNPLKKDKVMQNVVGTENYIEDGESKVREKIEDVLFVRGFLQVPVADKYGLYLFMELNPQNKNNRFRPNNVFVIFERIDIQHKTPAVMNMSTELAIDAGNAIRKMTKDDVLAYAITTNPPILTAGRRIDEIRGDLTRYAMNNPIQFFKQNKNIKAAIQITILDAISFGIIEYKPQKRAYINTETEEEIFAHSIQEEPEDAFVKYLAKEENKEKYDNIVERLNYWNEEP